MGLNSSSSKISPFDNLLARRRWLGVNSLLKNALLFANVWLWSMIYVSWMAGIENHSKFTSWKSSFVSGWLPLVCLPKTINNILFSD